MRVALIITFALAVSATASAQERTIWALVVNEVPKGDIEVILEDGGPLVDAAALRAAGIHRLPGDAAQAADTPVALATLAPLITYRLDEDAIQLSLTVDPSLLEQTSIEVSNPRPDGWRVRRNNAMFLNYSANWATNDETTGYGEFGMHLFGALLQTAGSVDADGVVTPGLTSLTFDQVGGRRRWTLGDTIGRSTTLGSSPVVGGFGIATQKDLDPYYVSYPSPQIRGAVRTPSIADVYVDGRLVQSVRLPPGQFALNQLPIQSGLGNARVIIRDVFGREQTVGLGFYLSTQLLKRGEQEYSYVAGLERTVVDTTVDYGRTLGTVFHSVGLTNWLTVGFQAEGAKDIVMGGLGFQARVWRLGILGAEGLYSQVSPKVPGYAATGLHTFTSRFFSTDLRATWIGPQFQTLFLEPADEEHVSADGSVSLSLGWFGSITAGGTIGSVEDFRSRLKQVLPDYLGRTYRPPPGAIKDALAKKRDRALRLGYTLNLTSRVQLSATATKAMNFGLPSTWEGFGSINIALGWRTMLSSVTSVDSDGAALTSVNMQRSLPLGPGFGFRIDADAQEPYTSQGTFEVQHRRGLIGVRVDGAQGEDTVTTVNLAGSVVAIGGNVMFSRSVDDGFALVRVRNSRGVRVNANNQFAGRTNGRGTLFVPDLRSYLSSPISIEQDDLPVSMRIAQVRQEIAVPYRGGAVVTFEVQAIRALVGRLDTGGDPPAYGTVAIDANGTRFESPLNSAGEFYFEDLPPGQYSAVATWQGRSCRAEMRLPEGTEPVVDVGAVRCVEVKP